MIDFTKIAAFLVCGVLAMAGSGCRLMHREMQATRLLEKSRLMSQQAVFAMEKGDLQEADHLLVQALQLCPQDVEARARYSRLLWRCGRQDEALHQLKIALGMAPQDAELHLQIAEQYLELGRLTEAQFHIQKVLELAPQNPGGWVLQGRLALARNDPEEALPVFHRAAGLRPNDREILEWIAQAYHARGDADQVLAVRQRIIDTFAPGEESVEALAALAEAYRAVKRYTSAAQTYLQAAGKAGNPEPYLLAAAENYLYAGEPARALSLTDQILAQNPQNSRARNLYNRLQETMIASQPNLVR
ncbi:MAG: tetratricopeptide repeat protein [Thermogutta sp.]